MIDDPNEGARAAHARRREELRKKIGKVFVDYHDPAEQLAQDNRVHRSRFMAGDPDWNKRGVGRPYILR